MTTITAGNLFEIISPATALAHEDVNTLLTRPGLKIERIVSHGHASPPGFWYDQKQHEWVVVLSGSARLRFEDEDEARLLAKGDHVLIPARKRHRVDWTCENELTVWLAVHFEA